MPAGAIPEPGRKATVLTDTITSQKVLQPYLMEDVPAHCRGVDEMTFMGAFRPKHSVILLSQPYHKDAELTH